MKINTKSVFKAFLLWITSALVTVVSLGASDWPAWRGPSGNGVSTETGLIDRWTADGENLLWRVDFTGRSTPIVLNGRVYVIGRVGEGVGKQEVVACFDARDGKQLWEHRFNVFLTTVPFSRVGWANLAGDPETGNVYAHGVGGLFICFDSDGKVLWQRSLTEELGRMSGYGGRTQTPVVDGDLVILGTVSSGWGDQAVPRHRYFAFDKLSGELVWVSTPGDRPYDLNTYSSPVVAVIQGRRALVGGNADGAIEALDIRSGEVIWRFGLSKRGINSQVVVDGDRVFASHSEENLDQAAMGRVVSIDATGRGDVTGTHEVWRIDQLTAGFASPAIQDGRLYIVDNSANLFCIDAATGKRQWEMNLGTVGKGSPVLADGKLFVTETNGTFHIVKLGQAEGHPLSEVTLKIGNRTAEIFASPAVAYGRIFFVTEEGLYCLGDKSREFEFEGPATSSRPVTGDRASTATHLQIVPADAILRADQNLQFHLRALDSSGRVIKPDEVQWALEGLSGRVGEDGLFQPAAGAGPEVGSVTVSAADLRASARVRLLPSLPWTEGFDSVEIGQTPPHWMGASGRFSVQPDEEDEGNKVLTKPFVRTGIQRSYVYIGASDMSGYTIEVDVKGAKEGRRVPDVGLIASRYAMALMGLRQEIQVHSWVSELRMATSVPFSWEPNVWYTMKMRVDHEDGKALIRGKAWPRGTSEPESWTIEAEDPYPNLEGTPGLFGQSYAAIYYDNIKVTEN